MARVTSRRGGAVGHNVYDTSRNNKQVPSARDRPLRNYASLGAQGGAVTPYVGGRDAYGRWNDELNTFVSATGSGTTLPFYDNAHVRSSAVAFKVAAVNGQTGSSSVRFDNMNQSPYHTNCSVGYFYFDALPGVQTQIIRYEDMAGTSVGGIKIQVGGNISNMKVGAQTAGTASAGAIPTGTWIRIEVKVNADVVNGYVEGKAWWTDPQSTGTPDWTSAVTQVNMGSSNIGRIVFGIGSATTYTTSWNMWMADLGVNGSDFLGPTVFYVDTGTALLNTSQPSSTDTAQRVDSGTALVNTSQPSSTESRITGGTLTTDSGTANVTITHPGSTDTAQRVDAGTAQVTTTHPSSTESVIRGDSGKPQVTISHPTGVDTAQRVDSGTALVTITHPSSSEFIVGTGVVRTDDDIGGWVADVLVANPSGTHGSWTQAVNQTVPVGAFLVVSAHGSTAPTLSMTDTGGNTYTRQITHSNGTFHSALYTCPVTTQLVSGVDTIHTGYAGSSATEIIVVASMYTGVTTVDTAADGANDVISTSLSMTGGAVTAQAFEFLYANYVLDTTAGSNAVTDNAWAKRTNIGSGDGARTMIVTDKDAYSTLTPSTSLHWTGSATCVGMLLPLKMAKLPSRMLTTPALVEGGAPIESGTANVNTTPSGTEVPPGTDSGRANLTTTHPGSFEGKNLLPADTGTINLTFDLTGSSESLVKTDFGTAKLNITQPFRQDLARYTETGTPTVVFTPKLFEGTFTPVDSCLHLTLSPRWDLAPVGVRWAGNAFVRYGAKSLKRWGTVNVGKCP